MAPGTLPTAMDRPHFIGIGGAGMSGIAKILAQRGAKVAGSDARDSATAEALRALGVTVHIGHDAAHLAPDATCVVVSSAIRADNPELARATGLGIPVVHRSDALASLMDGLRPIAVAGTHGKTTTTSMVAAMLDAGGIDPTVINGGIINRYGSNARLGKSDWMVVEADESDGSFLRLDGTIAVVSADGTTLTAVPSGGDGFSIIQQVPQVSPSGRSTAAFPTDRASSAALRS